MVQYVVFDKKMNAHMFLCKENTLISNDGEVLIYDVNRIYNICLFSEYEVCVCYEKNGSVYVSIINDNQVKGTKLLFQNKRFLQLEMAVLKNEFKIFTAEEGTNGVEMCLVTISSSNPKIEHICNGVRVCKGKEFKVFSSFNCCICAYLDENGVGIFDCNTEQKYFIRENDIKEYSICCNGKNIICLCVMKNKVKLYMFGQEEKQIEVFKGATANDCVVFGVRDSIFVCACDNENMFFRKVKKQPIYVSAMGKIPFKGAKLPVISLNKDFYCNEYIFDDDILYFLLSFEEYENKSIEAQEENITSKNIVVETLTKNMEHMSVENNLLNLRFKAAQDRYISTIENLKKSEESLKNEIEEIKKENEDLKKQNEEILAENSKIKNENSVLKKAKKMLEEEIYRINNEEKD